MSTSRRNSLEDLRSTATAIFTGALAGCNISAALNQAIRFEGNMLHRLIPQGGGPATIDLAEYKDIFIVAMGKAAGPMLDALLGRMRRRKGLRGICCWNKIPKRQKRRILYFAGGHPLPNEESFAAARATLALLSKAGQDTLIFFLISGGGSAMMELPLDPRITLEDTILFHQLLVGSGAPIDQINILRKHFSAVKGGRLAMAAPDAMKINLLLPDVPLQSLDALSSGPTSPDQSTADEVQTLLRRYDLSGRLPKPVRAFFDREVSSKPAEKMSLQRRETQLTAASPQGAFCDSVFEVLLSSRHLQERARSLAEDAGFFVVIDNTCDDWDYAEAAQYLLHRFHDLRANHPRLCLISVGEVTVKLNERPGLGGRNQQFVLLCALDLANYPTENLVVLSAGSDGIDGSTQAAGAIADGATVTRATELGYSTNASLAAFNAYPLFDALKDTIVTGPTGQNLRDVRILIAT